MCGIAGGILPKHTPQQRYELARKLLKESVSRGPDAAGIGFHLNGEPVVVKNGVNPNKFVTEDAFTDLKDRIPETFVLHTRRTTQGHERKNENNHPQFSEDLILVHNGTVDDSAWRATDKEGRNPYMYRPFQADVDTEAILRLVETMRYMPRNEDLSVTPDDIAATPKEMWTPRVSWLRAVDDACVNLDGSFACAMLVREEPNVLYLWRNSSPLYVAYIPEWDGVVFASEQKILHNALISEEVEYQLGVFPVKRYNYPEYGGVEMKDCDLWRIDYSDGNWDIKRYDIDPPAMTRRNVRSSRTGGHESTSTSQHSQYTHSMD